MSDRTGRFLRKPEPGSILVVDLADLDFDTGNLLAAYAPRAVLNASPIATGRGLATGATVLLESGTLVVDDLGGDVLGLRDGDEVQITGGNVSRKGTLIASGRVYEGRQETPEGDPLPSVDLRLRRRVEAQALSAARDFEEESSLILHGGGLPAPRVDFAGRIALVVTPSADLKPQVKRLKQFIGDHQPLIIGAGTGVAELQSVGLQPVVVVADPRDLDLKQLKRTRQVLVPSAGEEIPARDLLKRHSIAFDAVESNLSVTDLALLFADAAGASVIIDCSRPESLAEFFDAPGTQVIGSQMVAAKLNAKLVSLQATLAVYRPRVSGWWLALLFVAAVLAGAAAFFFTPLGDSLLGAYEPGTDSPIGFAATDFGGANG